MRNPALWRDDQIDSGMRAAQEREIVLAKQQIERYRRVKGQLFFGEDYSAWAREILPSNRG